MYRTQCAGPGAWQQPVINVAHLAVEGCAICTGPSALDQEPGSSPGSRLCLGPTWGPERRDVYIPFVFCLLSARVAVYVLGFARRVSSNLEQTRDSPDCLMVMRLRGCGQGPARGRVHRLHLLTLNDLSFVNPLPTHFISEMK